MFHLFVHRAVAATFLAWPAAASIAAEAQVHTDANLITVLDVSDSIMRHEEWLEFEGLAKAIVDAAVLDAIAGGRYGRIGFAVFTWSSGGRFEALVPWTLYEAWDVKGFRSKDWSLLQHAGRAASTYIRSGTGSRTKVPHAPVCEGGRLQGGWDPS
jgi:Protein of unknown function (DUF1194)